MTRKWLTFSLHRGDAVHLRAFAATLAALKLAEGPSRAFPTIVALDFATSDARDTFGVAYLAAVAPRTRRARKNLHFFVSQVEGARRKRFIEESAHLAASCGLTRANFPSTRDFFNAALDMLQMLAPANCKLQHRYEWVYTPAAVLHAAGAPVPHGAPIAAPALGGGAVAHGEHAAAHEADTEPETETEADVDTELDE